MVAFVMAGGGGEEGGEIGLIQILGGPSSTPIKSSQFGVGREAAMIRGPAEPAESLSLVARDFIVCVALKIAKAERVLGCGVALLRHLQKLLEGCSLDCGPRGQ